MKPDFYEMAKRALDQWDINRVCSAVAYAIEDAYNLGVKDEKSRCHNIASDLCNKYYSMASSCSNANDTTSSLNMAEAFDRIAMLIKHGEPQ